MREKGVYGGGQYVPRKGGQFGSRKGGQFTRVFHYREIKEESIVVLALSDGVGSRRNDDVASQTACNVFVDSISNSGSNVLLQRFEAAINKADEKVTNPENPEHKGMMCTFIGVVWDVMNNWVLYDSIGDSRLYKYSGSGIIQISTDSSKTALMRDKRGRLITQNGMPVMRDGVSNALGYNRAEMLTKRLEFNHGEALILCSDGMYSIPDFDSLIKELMLNADIENATEKFVKMNQDNFEDDASLLIIRRTDQPENYSEKYNNIIQQFADYRQHDIIAHLLADFIQSELLRLLEHKQDEMIKKYTLYIETFHLRLSESFIEKAIQLMKTTDFVIMDLYHMLIKQLKIIKR